MRPSKWKHEQNNSRKGQGYTSILYDRWYAYTIYPLVYRRGSFTRCINMHSPVLISDDMAWLPLLSLCSRILEIQNKPDRILMDWNYDFWCIAGLKRQPTAIDAVGRLPAFNGSCIEKRIDEEALILCIWLGFVHGNSAGKVWYGSS